mgnify:CR=1 FL=1
MINGKATKILFIKNFWESFTIQPPTNKLIETKCIQKSIRKRSLANKLERLEIPKYNSKLIRKSYELKKDLYSKKI